MVERSESDQGSVDGSVRPPTRDRARTESRLLEATRQLVDRDGILAGLNLKEVSELAGVNRGLIYQYFGSRQELLRAALGEREWRTSFPFSEEGRALPFNESRMMAYSLSVEMATYIQLEALRAIDDDEALTLFPRLDELRRNMAEQQQKGEISPDIEPMAAYIATTSLFRGYAIFREFFARELDVLPEELDAHVGTVVQRMLQGLTAGEDPTEGRADTGGRQNE